MTPPVAVEVVRWKDWSPGHGRMREAIVPWSDGTEGVAVSFFYDEILICEGDLVGRTRHQIDRIHLERDRDYLLADEP